MNAARIELYSQMCRRAKAEKELREIALLKVEDEDFAGLREKAGERFVRLTLETIKADIKKDIEEAKELENGIVCEFEYEVEKAIRNMGRRIAEDVIRYFLGGFESVTQEQRDKTAEIVKGWINSTMYTIHRKA